MKKVLIEREIHAVLMRKSNFLVRSDIRVFTAGSNDEALAIHRAERIDLIIQHLEMPGMSSEQFTSLIREDLKAGRVRLIMVCANNINALEHCTRCGANAIILRPINPPLLLAKAQQLLDISWRETYRVILSAVIEGKAGEEVFYCRSQDISPSGMRIETEKNLALGGRVVCSVVLPNSTKVQADGEIVRIIQRGTGAASNQYGVRFNNLSSETRRVLDSFVDEKNLEKRSRVA